MAAVLLSPQCCEPSSGRSVRRHQLVVDMEVVQQGVMLKAVGSQQMFRFKMNGGFQFVSVVHALRG